MPDLPDSVDDPRRECLCEASARQSISWAPVTVLAQGSCGRRAIALSDMFWNGEAV